MNKLFFILLFPLLLNSVNYEITVPANVEWFNSEIEVYENELVSIESEGVWRYDPRPNFETGPEGLVKGKKDLGSLLMKCNNQIILIENQWENVIDEECVLHFGMCDDLGHSNNMGSLNVYINIEREIVEEEEKEKVDEVKEEETELVDVPEDEEEIPFIDETCSFITFLILLTFGVLYVQERNEK
jgi:hypothetical protein